MNEYIDIYCERLEPGFWAEPLNALSNGMFFIAAIFALALAGKNSKLTFASGLLIFLIFAMGVGSSLFHTYAERWAMIADVVPILLYQLCFIVLYTRYVMRGTWGMSVILLCVFFALSIGISKLPSEILNGSLQYAPALILLTFFSIWHYLTQQKEKLILIITCVTFTVSLTFRSIDMSVCEYLPIGTHYLWHCLNALVLYLTARSFIINTAKL
ncbi:MAG: hypothetical protein CBB87_07080 [Micavibrio sp. TMED27]|nr:hypothetical protein [Micavibrio sp.]OUT91074.1 MAG: hypothetical protein CBB87_07080 [Micavibrio sp. TMED27]|tara:strand:- start:1052 stop:1693 length:642 start_codon:yes stop_codon:yes gene_type:complete